MTLQHFLNLVRRGETATVDFKLICNAFNRAAGDQDKARAELVKDICAMANNGSSTSYLIIGLGDDRVSVRSANDPNLSSQNIQSLVRDAIHPRPLVGVHLVEWPDAPKPFAGVRFVVVQVGPNARHAFRLARDMISWSHNFHFRKNEVWIRNQDTSDLATPEQIGRLLGRSRAYDDTAEATYSVVEYHKLATADQRPALARDVQQFFSELGAKLVQLPLQDRALPEYLGHFRVCVLIGRRPFVFRCVFLHRLTSEDDRRFYLNHGWLCEHGLLVFVLGRASSVGKFHGLIVNSDLSWGSLAQLRPRKHSVFRSRIPETFAEVPFTILTFANLKNTKRVREALSAALQEIESDSILFTHLDDARSGMNRELRRWVRKSPNALVKAFDAYGSVERREAFKRHAAAVIELVTR